MNRYSSRFLQFRGQLLGGLRRRQRVVPGALQRVVVSLRELRVAFLALFDVSVRIHDLAQQRVREARFQVPAGDDDARGQRLRESPFVAGEQLARRAGGRGDQQQRIARRLRQRVQPVGQQSAQPLRHQQRVAGLDHGPRSQRGTAQLQRVEGVPAAGVPDPLRQLVGGTQAQAGAQQLGDHRSRQVAQRDLDRVLRQQSPPGGLLSLREPLGGQHVDAAALAAADGEGQHLGRGRVQAVDVVQDQQHRALRRQRAQRLDHRDADGELVGGRAVGHRAHQHAVEGGAQVVGHDFGPGGDGVGEQVVQAQIRQPRLGRGRRAAQHQLPGGRARRADRVQQRRFADPGRAAHQNPAAGGQRRHAFLERLLPAEYRWCVLHARKCPPVCGLLASPKYRRVHTASLTYGRIPYVRFLRIFEPINQLLDIEGAAT